MKKNSRGLSTIVATLLIILLTLVAVGVIWIVVRNVIQDGAEQISLGKFTLNLEITQVQKINESALSVTVKRNAGDGEFVGINFIIDDGDNTEVIKTNISLKELEVKNFELHLLVINASRIKKISIVPIFRLESGKEVNGDVKDEYIVSTTSSGISSCTPSCPSGAVCGSDGCGGSCGTCSGSTPNCINYQCSAQVCTPSCLNKQCGSDGCDGDCGTCLLANAVASCSASYQCVISSCNSGYANCDSNISNGCETTLGTMTNCASCGNVCTTGQTCTNYQCITQTTPPTNWQTGLVSWWRFNGNAQDSSMGMNHGIVNGATLTNTGCKSGQCYSFDAVNDYIDLGGYDNVPLTDYPTDNFTIAAWIKIRGNPTNGYGRILGKVGTHVDFEVNYNRLSARVYNVTSQSAFFSGNTVLNLNQWYFATIVYNGSRVELFLNGLSDGSRPLSGPILNPQYGYMIGTIYDPGNDYRHNFNGSIDELMIFNRPLNITEIQELYNYTYPSQSPTCSDNIQNQDETSVDCGGICSPCSPRTFYVSNSGDDSSSGLSQSTPWRTISKVSAYRLGRPGDTILFKRGDMWREQLNVPSSGTAGNPITFGAYGTGAKPILNGANIITGWEQYSTNVWIGKHPPIPASQNSWGTILVIDGELFTEVATLGGVNTAGKYYVDRIPYPNLIYVYSTTDPDSHTTEVSARLYGMFVGESRQYLKIENMEFRNAASMGLRFSGYQPQGNCIVDNCTFYRNRIIGITFDNGYSNNIVQNSIATYSGSGFYAWSTYVNRNSKNNTFRYCYADHNIRYLVGTITDGHGFGIYNSDDCVVEHSESSYDQCGIQVDANQNANDVILRYNYIHDTTNGTPGIGLGGNIPAGTVHQAYYNIIINTGDLDIYSYPIAVGSTTRSGKVYLYNNVIYQDGGLNHGKVGSFMSTPNGVTFKNNLVYIRGSGATTGIISGIGTFDAIDNNIYYFPDASASPRWLTNWLTYYTLSTWRAAVSDEENSMTSNPLLTNSAAFDFSLQSGSPAINAGTDVGLTRDYNGNPIVGLPDIGAFEHS